mgnify:CR=1 FL=1
MKKIFYEFVALTLSIYNNFFFKKLTIIGKEKIPKDGAIIFSPNHQSAFLDPLLVGVTNGKRVYSLTRSDVFRKPFLWILDAMQTLPVYRIRDGYEKLLRNKETFGICYELLKNKNNLMIFSEGKHHNKYFLLPISKGSSRIGLESLKKNPKTKIYLQAVGINYGSHIHPYHNCIVVYGNPIKLNEFIKLYEKKPVETLNRVRLELENEMKKCLWLPNYSTEYNIKRSLINYQSTKQEFKILKNKISKKDTDLRDNDSKTAIEKIAVTFFSIFNLIPLIIINSVLKRVEDRVFHLSIKYLIGIFIFPLWWTIVFFISVYFLNLTLSLVIIIFLVLFLFLRQFLIIKYK